MDAHTAGNVRLLSLFHYVLAGLAAVSSLLPGLYIAMGWAVVSGTFPGRSGSAPPPALGYVIIAVGAVLMLLGFGYAIVLLLAGRSLARTRHWTFCVVVAGLSCAFFPFGTVLGVLTIVTLVKPEVRVAFEGGAAARAPPPPPYATGG